MKKKIIVLGASGFLGSSFLEYFKKTKKQYDVYGLCLNPVEEGKRMIKCDLNHSKKLRKTLFDIKADYIFNLAGGRIKDEKKLYKNNYLSTSTLLEAIGSIDNYNPKIVMPGTAAEYGLPSKDVRKIKEDTCLCPISWYGFVKCLQTDLCLKYSEQGYNIVVARMFNVSGKGVSSELAIGRFSKDIALIESGQKDPVLNTKNLNGKRDFLDVKDVCSALWLLAKNGKSGEIYNVCSGKAFTIKSLLLKLIKMSKVKNIEINEEIDKSSKSCDIVGSNRKLVKETNWKQSVSVEKSLKNSFPEVNI